jgi:hypothetical protein
VFARQVEGFDAVTGTDRGVAMGFQQIVEELHIELVVLHNQDSFGHPRSFGCPKPNIRRR